MMNKVMHMHMKHRSGQFFPHGVHSTIVNTWHTNSHIITHTHRYIDTHTHTHTHTHIDT